MKRFTPLLSTCALVIGASLAAAADPGDFSPNDFAYRMKVNGTADSAAYRVALPLALYQKIVHADLADLRVFNARGERVPFAIERPASETGSNAAAALSL